MEITAGLLTKAGCGLGAAGLGVTGIYFGGEYINNMLSNYEKALIGFLEGGTEHDIKFEVKKGDGSALDATSLVLSGTGAAVSVFAKVQVTGGTTSSFKNGGSDATDKDKGMSDIKDLNNGS